MNKYLIPILFILSIGVVIYFVGMNTGPEIPDIVLERDRCAQCGMVISSKPYAALAYDVSKGEWVKFDDIGCLLKYMIENGGLDNFEHIHVFDYKTNELVEAGNAYFVRASVDELWTPMSSGIVAFKDRADAEALAESTGGEVYTFSQLYAWAAQNPDMIYQKMMNMNMG